MIYIANGIYSDAGPDYIVHSGRKGMKWYQHIFGEDKHSTGRRKRRSVKQWMENKDRANSINAQANQVKGVVNGNLTVNGKTKKLPSTSLGLLMNYKSLSESEYRQAMNKIRRRNEVYDNVINDAYRLHRAVNFAPTVLNDAVRTAKNVEYVAGTARKLSNRSGNIVLGKKMKIVNVPTSKSSTVPLGISQNRRGYSSQLNDDVVDILNDYRKSRKGKALNHSDILCNGNYLEHYGRKGMKWGQHIFGDEDQHSHRYQKYLKSAQRGFSFIDDKILKKYNNNR